VILAVFLNTSCGNTVLDAMAGSMLFVGVFLKKMKVNSLWTQ
jgi:hypothetical protein